LDNVKANKYNIPYIKNFIVLYITIITI